MTQEQIEALKSLVSLVSRVDTIARNEGLPVSYELAEAIVRANDARCECWDFVHNLTVSEDAV